MMYRNEIIYNTLEFAWVLVIWVARLVNTLKDPIVAPVQDVFSNSRKSKI